jgi:hypothetical protein
MDSYTIFERTSFLDFPWYGTSHIYTKYFSYKYFNMKFQNKIPHKIP